MAKTTLLSIVQGILSDSDGDEVNDVGATVEAQQCASIISDEFTIIVDEFDIKHHETLVKLDATAAATPTVMIRPEGFHSIEWIKYNTKATAGGDQTYTTITYRDPVEFLELTMSRTASDTDVEEVIMPDSSQVILVKNDVAPTYWTVLEGYDYIVFDSYDSVLETNLQQSKVIARGVQRPTLIIANTTVPNLPENQMALLKNRARAMYFDLFKDGTTKEVDKRQRNSEVRSQRKKYITRQLQDERSGVNYGRK